MRTLQQLDVEELVKICEILQEDDCCVKLIYVEKLYLAFT